MTFDDHALISRLTELLARERELRAEFIVHLAEFDRRRLYLVAGYPSLFAWLTERMRISKASAYRRVTAARLVARVPAVEAVLRDGRVSLTKLCALKDVLNAEGAEELLGRAASMTEQEVEELAVAMSPRRDAPPPPRDSIRIIVPPAAPPEPLFAPRPVGSVAEPAPAPAPARRVITMSVGPEFMQLLDDVRAALSHSHPCASLETLLGGCMKMALSVKAKKVKAEAERPRTRTKAPRGRHIPAEVRRTVWKRDGSRCSFVSDDGRRCSATERLELHHRVPFGRGGAATVENLAVLCSLHNDLAARHDYGDVVMDRFTSRAVARPRPPHDQASGP